MPPVAAVFLAVFGGVMAAVAAVWLFSRLYYKRSLMATLAEWFLFLTEKRYPDEQVIADLPKLPLKNDAPLSVPKRFARKMRIEERFYGGMQTFVFHGEDGAREGQAAKTAALYLHGGGYVRNPRPQHWKFAFQVAKRAGAAVFFAVYPKAPKHTFEEAYARLTELYKEMRERFERVVFMGDSSGGGLAMGLAEALAATGERQPERLILLSPWVDVSLENPALAAYERTDPIVCISNERIWGAAWAGGEDVKHPKISPIFGNLTSLPPITLFAGTRETLYPDLKKLEEMLKKEGKDVTMYEGKGLGHVYPIYPIPEAKQALNAVLAAMEN